MARTLGLELSTQSAKIVVLDEKEGVVYRKTLSYDERFPAYRTAGGVLHSVKGERHTSPYMLVEALDACFQQMKQDGAELGRIDALKLDGMQHCTVYLGEGFKVVLRQSGSPRSQQESLVDLFRAHGAFTRETSPIWEDRNTAQEVGELMLLLKPLGGVIAMTGNRAEMRFPAAQIMKWMKEDMEAYSRTRHILLLSSFATSLLAGQLVPADTGDGFGTNLNTLDITSPSFDSRICKAVDASLGDKNRRASRESHLLRLLGRMVPYDQPFGKINPYFSRRYGVNPKAIVLAGTGDNPATLLGCGGGLVLSLGSSYTLMGVQKGVSPSNGEDNVYGFVPGRTMSLVCFTNGGKLHEEFLRRYVLKGSKREIAARDWAAYERLTSAEGFGSHMMLPYLLAESVPLAPAGIVRSGFSDKDAAKNISALYFSQMAALRVHSRHMEIPPEICLAAGGGKSVVMRQLAADIFGRTVYTIENAEYAAPLGCAIAAMRHVLRISYEDAAKRFVQKSPESVTHPQRAEVARMQRAVDAYRSFERRNERRKIGGD